MPDLFGNAPTGPETAREVARQLDPETLENLRWHLGLAFRNAQKERTEEVLRILHGICMELKK